MENMKLKEIKKWINELSDEFLEFQVANGEYGQMGNDLIGYERHYRINNPIVGLEVDESTKEVLFLHQGLEEIDNIKK